MIFGSKSRDKSAPSAGTNGGDSPRPGPTKAKVAGRAKTARRRPREARQSRMAHTFAQVVGVLMRDANFRNLRIADLEWLVLPPIMAGQFKFAYAMRQPDDKAKQSGVSVPVAVALWARVSPQIDKGLSENLDKLVRLRPDQWASGNHLWLMAVGGDRRAVPQFLKELGGTPEFKGQHVKMRARAPDGKVIVKALSQDK